MKKDKNKETKKHPIDHILEILKKVPKFDADKAWQEVKEERKRERS